MSIAIVTFGWGLAWRSIWVPTILTFFVAFFRLAANPGCVSFCIELNPHSPSSVMATISSFQIFVVRLLIFFFLSSFFFFFLFADDEDDNNVVDDDDGGGGKKRRVFSSLQAQQWPRPSQRIIWRRVTAG